MLPGPINSGVKRIEFSPDSNFILAKFHDGALKLFEKTTANLVPGPFDGQPVSSWRFSPDGAVLATVVIPSQSEQFIRLWSTKTGSLLAESVERHRQGFIWPIGLVFAEESDRLLAVSQREVHLWEKGCDETWSSKKIFWRLENDPLIEGATFIGGRKVVIYIRSSDSVFTVKIWPAEWKWDPKGDIIHEGALTDISFDPSGARFTTFFNNAIRCWDAETGRPVVEPIKCRSKRCHSEFGSSEDGHRLYLNIEDEDGQSLWDIRPGAYKPLKLCHKEVVYTARFSPDGRKVITASADGTARIWNAGSGEGLGNVLKHDDAVNSAEFSPDGRLAVTASLDNTVRIWNSQSGELAYPPLKHRDWVWDAQFTADGQKILTYPNRGDIHLWDVATGQLIESNIKRHSERTKAFCKDTTAESISNGRRIVAGINGVRLCDTVSGMPLTENMGSELELIVRWQKDFKGRLSPGAERLVVISKDQNFASVWECPVVPLPVPSWFPRILEAIARQRVIESGCFAPVSMEEIMALKIESERKANPDFYGNWVQWFFADRSNRAQSPFPKNFPAA